MRAAILMAAAIAIIAASPVEAQTGTPVEAQTGTPPAADAAPASAPVATPATSIVSQLYDCRAIVDATARLACYDQQVAALQSAQANRDIRIIDREQVREARRGLFGFTLGKIRLFGGGDDNDDAQAGNAGSGDNAQAAPSEDVSEIEVGLVSARQAPDGNWVLTFDNEQVWRQTDGRDFINPPRAGQRVRIRRAALGSYLASIEGRTGFRVRRER